MRRFDRRSFVRGVAGLGVVGVAGCNGGQSEPDDAQADENGGSGGNTDTQTSQQSQEQDRTLAFHDKITATAPQPKELFGTAVDVANGAVFVGTVGDDTDAGTDAGSVSIFERGGERWTEAAKLTASGTADGDRFGNAIDADGTRALIGASLEDHSDASEAGAVYLFERENGEWSQRERFVASDGGRLDHFGRAVALDGGTAAIGAPGHAGNNGVDSGAVYVFEQATDGWEQSEKLAPIALDRADSFGWSVALAGDAVIVGAPTDEDPNGSKSGTLYHFTRSNGEWDHQGRIAPEGAEPGARVGAAIDLSGDTLLVGAPSDVDEGLGDPGAAYVFVRSGTAWTQQAKLVRSDGGSEDSGDTDDVFGYSVALVGDLALVGAPRDEDPNGMQAGSAYAFRRTADGWTQVNKFAARHGRPEERFAQAVALGETLGAVGTPQENLAEGLSAGAVHLYSV